MSVRLDPTVIDQLLGVPDTKSYEKLGARLGRSAHTVSKWHKGKTTPGSPDLVKLQFLTGRPYGTMLLIDKNPAQQVA